MIFEEGIKVDKDTLKRGTHSVDTHVFIRNDLWENLEEIKLNLVDFNGLPCKRSDLINMSIYFLCESLNLAKCDDQRIAILLDLKERYKEKLNRNHRC